MRKANKYKSTTTFRTPLTCAKRIYSSCVLDLIDLIWSDLVPSSRDVASLWRCAIKIRLRVLSLLFPDDCVVPTGASCEANKASTYSGYSLPDPHVPRTTRLYMCRCCCRLIFVIQHQMDEGRGSAGISVAGIRVDHVSIWWWNAAHSSLWADLHLVGGLCLSGRDLYILGC